MSASCARSCAMSARCDGNMEQGSMRADVNVSVRKPGDPLGTRTETKNVNSVRFIMAVIEHEARRQVDVIEDGGTIVQETRLFDPDKQRDALAPLQGGRARLSLLPGSGPAAGRARATPSSRNAARACPSCRTPSARATRASWASRAYNAAVLTAEVETARWFEALLAAPGKAGDRAARLQLGDLGTVRRAQPARQGHRGQPGHAGAGRANCSA